MSFPKGYTPHNKGKQFCPSGHDTFKCGRNTSRFCRKCARLRTAKHRIGYNRDCSTWRRQLYKENSEYREKIKERARLAFRRKIKNCPAQIPLGSLCEICGNGKTERLRPDHDHKTNLFRGWLCRQCNTGIALLGDTFVRVNKAADYLARSV